MEAPLDGSAPRVLYMASSPHGQIAAMAASAQWIVWAEYVGEPAHARIYGMRRVGGAPHLIDDLSMHALAYLPDFTIEEADVYWSLPLIVDGVWQGLLMHRHLPDGQAEVLQRAPSGSIYGWPSAHAGSLAFEVADQTASKAGHPRYHVALRQSDGVVHDLPLLPASEPSLGDRVLVVKHSDRFAEGPIAVVDLVDGKVTDLRDGEGARLSGTLSVWHSNHPGDAGDYWSSVTGRACVQRLGPAVAAGEATVSAPAVAAGHVAWVYRRTTQTQLAEFIEVAPILRPPCG
ncbi:MAG: hypothetical protein KGJ98_01435 [Chloroflexota bacterium]|nr:hypothetical protein [Chloroflexota bacterium]